MEEKQNKDFFLTSVNAEWQISKDDGNWVGKAKKQQNTNELNVS